MNRLLTAVVSQSALAIILAGAGLFAFGFYLAFGFPAVLMVVGILVVAFGIFTQ